MSRILILSPHTDDAEIGVGGTISRLLREGNEVSCLVFSKAYPSESFEEFKKSMNELGVSNLFFGDFNVRYLNYSRQEVLDKILEVRDKVNPDIIFMPSTDDFHQDHQTVCQEGLRAFKNKTIFGYEYPWNTLATHLDCFYKIEQGDLDKKINALSQYVSQKDRPFLNKDFIKNWAELNGIKIGVPYAESFQTIRLIS